jgi:threonine dehydratase
MVMLADIERARQTISGQVLRTPLLPAPPLSALAGAEVFVKYENLQVTNSFKERGACVKLAALSADERRRGVIAMSAGNHAQAVAYHARRLAVPATIVMPVTTPFVKIKATERLGATVILDGETVAEAQTRAEAIASAQNLVWVHPYDDPLIIAGQGTIALEMLEDCAELDVLVVPIGGGGLVAGCAVAARAQKPSIEIIGVEAALYPSMWNAIHQADRPCGGATHRGEECRQAHFAGCARSGQRHRPGRRGADRTRGERLPHLAESDGGRCGCRRPRRHAGRAASISRT